MALTPHFDRIIATITASDVEKFLRSAAPEDDKQRVRDAVSNDVKLRLVGGYLIRTNQIPQSTLKPAKKAKATTKPRATSKV